MRFLEKYTEYLGVDPLQFASWLSGMYTTTSKKNYHAELRDVELSDEFKKKYHPGHSKYYNLYIDGKKVSDTLYTKGFSTIENINENKYVAISKYTPAKYTIEEKNKYKEWKISVGDYHLEEKWVIIDTADGKEMMEFGQFDAPYIHDNIAVHKRTYYYIPTGEIILDNVYSGTIETETYIIVPQNYNKSAAMINKLTGEKTEIN